MAPVERGRSPESGFARARAQEGELSALFLPVPEAEPLLDAVRGLEGVALLEPAHISLGYPWVRDPSADRVREAARQVKPHVVELSGPELFVQDVRQRTVVHALLSDESVPRRLAELLDAPLRTPHLSLARVRRNGDVGAVVDALEGLLPLTVRLEALELTVRAAPGTWTTLVRVPLGG